MDSRLAEELYSESLLLSKTEMGSGSHFNCKQDDSHDCDEDDIWQDDGSLCVGSDEEPGKSSDLDREWQRRHDQFHTIGYRDGLIAGKEASAQEGFNIGFKQSVYVGYNWGIVRGVTSVLASLPDGLKESLVETKEKRNEFKSLHETVHSLSTTDALRLFNDDIVAKRAGEQHVNAEPSSDVVGLPTRNSDCGHLREYSGMLQKLLLNSPSINVHLPDS